MDERRLFGSGRLLGHYGIYVFWGGRGRGSYPLSLSLWYLLSLNPPWFLIIPWINFLTLFLKRFNDWLHLIPKTPKSRDSLIVVVYRPNKSSFLFWKTNTWPLHRSRDPSRKIRNVTCISTHEKIVLKTKISESPNEINQRQIKDKKVCF